jgi:arylsulfatase A-like enzyme
MTTLPASVVLNKPAVSGTADPTIRPERKPFRRIWCPIVRIMLGAFALATTANAADPAAAKPRILVILADDLGNQDVGFQGAKDIPTPNLDSLAKSGVRCTNGYVSHPFCSPTRAGLITGRYQQRFGHENNPTWLPNDASVGLPLSETTLPEALKRAGYVTGAVGKWHLGAHANLHPNSRGFDEYFGLRGGGHQYFDHNLFLKDPVLAETIENRIPLHRNRQPVAEHEYLTDALGREAAAFVSKHKGQPWFLYLAFNAPHLPLQAPERYLDRVRGIADKKRRTYAAMITALDDAVGRVLTTLRESGDEANTLIFFLSDNGGPENTAGADNGPYRDRKGSVYEGGIRVPFVVRWPDRLKPGVYDQPVSSLDIFATSLAAAGSTETLKKPLDGVNLIPYLRGESSTPPHDHLFWRAGGGDQFAVREGRWKLVGARNQQPELYDLSIDESESRNLADHEPAKQAALLQLYAGWNRELIAPRWQNPPRNAPAPAIPNKTGTRP